MIEPSDRLLHDAFPEFAHQIDVLRQDNDLLDEICRDFLVLLRQLHDVTKDPAKIQASYVAHLSEGIEELRKEIQDHLRVVATPLEQKKSRQQTGKEME